MKTNLFLLTILATSIIACSQSTGKTKSGYRFAHHIKTGGATPKPGDVVYYHITERINDKIMGSTYQYGTEPMNNRMPTKEELGTEKVPAMVEAMEMMSVGDSMTIFVSLDSIKTPIPGVENAKEAALGVRLTKIMSAEEANKEAAEKQKVADEQKKVVMARNPAVETAMQAMIKDYSAGKLKDKLQKTASGLQYIIQESGTGSAPQKGKVVSVNYYGALKDGKVFDNSFSRGAPIEFPLGVGQVIPGWDEGIGLLKKGAKAVFFIPSALGYGAQGAGGKIPANAELIFYVELEDVK
jgi:FKBP-type peptidyl-prolyl cis-trans isomerase FkpA